MQNQLQSNSDLHNQQYTQQAGNRVQQVQHRQQPAQPQYHFNRSTNEFEYDPQKLHNYINQVCQFKGLHENQIRFPDYFHSSQFMSKPKISRQHEMLQFLDSLLH